VYYPADLSQIEGGPANKVDNLRYALPLLPWTLVDDTAFVTGAVGLALWPLSIACLHRGLTRRVAVSVLGLGFVFLALVLTDRPYIPPLSSGSTWAFFELGATEPLVPGFQPPAFPSWWRALVIFVAGGSTAIFLATLPRRFSHPGEAFLGWVTLGHFLLMAILWLFYDRYALVVLPSAIGLLLTGGISPRPLPTLVFLVLFGGVSVVGVRDHLQYNQALWQAVALLRQRGVPDADIDGGYIVNGWLHYAHPHNAPRDERGNILVPGLTTARNPLRYVIANRFLPQWRVVTTMPYQRWWGRSGTIYILERSASALPAPAGEGKSTEKF
jgi:hypothetical protein